MRNTHLPVLGARRHCISGAEQVPHDETDRPAPDPRARDRCIHKREAVDPDISDRSTAGIVLHGEPFPGIPAGTIDGGLLDGVRVVTKAGAFGEDDVLVEVIDYLS